MDDVARSEHKVTVINREHIEIFGVLHVDSFDDEEIILETDLGLLALRGEELHIKQLNLDEGHLQVEGIIKNMDYLEDVGLEGLRKKSRGVLSRIFK